MKFFKGKYKWKSCTTKSGKVAQQKLKISSNENEKYYPIKMAKTSNENKNCYK